MKNLYLGGLHNMVESERGKISEKKEGASIMTHPPQSLLRGNYVAQTLAQADDMKRYVFTQQDGTTGFRDFDGTVSVAANQCWVECSMPEASELILRFDVSTGIYDTPSLQQGSPERIYNIAGQRLSKAQRGINVIGNKKVLVD